MKFKLSHAKAIAGRFSEHPRVKRLRRWWSARNFTLTMALGGLALLILTGWAIADFVRVAKTKDEIHQESVLRSQLAEFLLSTREPDGSSLLENPAENTRSVRPAQVMTIRRPFFTYFLTRDNQRSFQADEIRFTPPRSCSTEFAIETKRGSVQPSPGANNTMQACFGILPLDPAGRYVYFALRYPSPPITRHSPGKPLTESDRVILQFAGPRTVAITLTFEAPPTSTRRRAPGKKLDGFHEVAGFLMGDGGKPNRAVQAQAYERAQDGESSVVTILGRIDSRILPGFNDGEAWPSSGIKALRIGAAIAVAPVDGKPSSGYGFAPGHIGKAVMSLEQAYMSSVVSRAALVVRAENRSASDPELWSSTALDIHQDAAPPTKWQELSNWIARLVVRGVPPIHVSQPQDIDGLPRMTATLTAERIVIPDIAARAFMWIVVLLITILCLIAIAIVKLSKLDRLTRTAHSIATAHRLGGLEQFANEKDQIGTLGRVMHVLFQRDQKRLNRHLRRVESDTLLRQQALAKELELLKIRQHNLHAIGHGIKSPLGTLLASRDLSERHRRALEGMRRNVEALYEANRLEDGVKNGEIVVSHQDIAEYVAEFTERLREERHPVTADGPTSGIVAVYDPITLDQHLDHVVNNALRYANGTNIEISVRAEVEMAVIEVFNYGKHIEDTVAIFSLGVTDRLSSESMGLGLYAAKIQIGGMNGNIVAENREGGVAFVITLPLSKGAQVT